MNSEEMNMYSMMAIIRLTLEGEELRGQLLDEREAHKATTKSLEEFRSSGAELRIKNVELEKQVTDMRRYVDILAEVAAEVHADPDQLSKVPGEVRALLGEIENAREEISFLKQRVDDLDIPF